MLGTAATPLLRTNWHNAMGLSQAREHVIMVASWDPLLAHARDYMYICIHTFLHFAGETSSGSCISCVKGKTKIKFDCRLYDLLLAELSLFLCDKRLVVDALTMPWIL